MTAAFCRNILTNSKILACLPRQKVSVATCVRLGEYPRVCSETSCGEIFKARRSTAQFCSATCRKRAHRRDDIHATAPQADVLFIDELSLDEQVRRVIGGSRTWRTEFDRDDDVEPVHFRNDHTILVDLLAFKAARAVDRASAEQQEANIHLRALMDKPPTLPRRRYEKAVSKLLEDAVVRIRFRAGDTISSPLLVEHLRSRGVKFSRSSSIVQPYEETR